MLDAGVLVAIDRGDSTAKSLLRACIHTNNTRLQATEPVLAQVWRNGSRQARLSSFLRHIVVIPLDDGKMVGRLLAASGTKDVVDAHLVCAASASGTPILTGDVDDINRLTNAIGAAAPRVFQWPPPR